MTRPYSPKFPTFSLAVPLSDMKRVIMHHIFKIWQESWSQQLDNKLHSVKPVIGAWPVMPMRRTDVKLTRLRIGHTRFTHRNLLLGEDAPECPSCKVNGRCTLVPCASIGWWDGLLPAWDQAIDTFADSCVKGGGLHRDVLKDYLPPLDRLKQSAKCVHGDLLVEISTTKQAEQLLALQMLANIPITVLPHANLNSSRGVISESDLYNVPEQEILEGLQDQKVCAVRRITIRRDGQVVNTKHLILTFACPDLPQFITAGYLRCSVRPYIPNPLRCFQCQRFGHSKPSGGSPSLGECGFHAPEVP
ncbi:uncharacterized protein TNCV_2576561 [Trichonephila clavipes]|nr:uncharacterized protein TNCV_2576561 [Trichonephila clavipes]